MASYAMIIGNAELPAEDIVHSLVEGASFVLCADGGANAAMRLGITPHAIIGDLDSIDPGVRTRFEDTGVPVLFEAGQDDTDLEKALRLLETRGCRRVIIIGITGLLLDHTFGNFSILLRYLARIEILIFDKAYRIDFLRGARRFSSHPGQRVSIVPFPEARGVSLSGLKYTLKSAELAFGVMEGTCNEAVGKSFRVVVDSGMVMVFRAH